MNYIRKLGETLTSWLWVCWEVLTVNLHGVIGAVAQIIFACFVWPYVSYTVVGSTLDVQEWMFYTRYFRRALLGLSPYAAVSTLTDLLLTGNFI